MHDKYQVYVITLVTFIQFFVAVNEVILHLIQLKMAGSTT